MKPGTPRLAKGADQHTFERFDTERLADEPAVLKRFVFLLGAERVVPEAGRCHLYSLLEESQKVGRELGGSRRRPERASMVCAGLRIR